MLNADHDQIIGSAKGEGKDFGSLFVVLYSLRILSTLYLPLVPSSKATRYSSLVLLYRCPWPITTSASYMEVVL